VFDYSNARQYLKNKKYQLQSQRFSLWQQAKQDSLNIIEMIIQKYHPQYIIQWGSILEPKHFSEVSDIDLAIAGIDSIVFMNLLAEAENLTTFSLDLVRWEELHPSFQNIIAMKGKVIYEHGRSTAPHC
jgi:predicted nucleotidyltransferase